MNYIGSSLDLPPFPLLTFRFYNKMITELNNKIVVSTSLESVNGELQLIQADESMIAEVIEFSFRNKFQN